MKLVVSNEQTAFDGLLDRWTNQVPAESHSDKDAYRLLDGLDQLTIRIAHVENRIKMANRIRRDMRPDVHPGLEEMISVSAADVKAMKAELDRKMREAHGLLHVYAP